MTVVPKSLPQDLLTFLQSGRQLEYDVGSSSIGRIALKRGSDLSLSTITINPEGTANINDPYRVIDGVYEVDVYDLVAESDAYGVEGLLCWIVALEQFGCVDSEHGTVLAFPDATWRDIVANPVSYLDAQWCESAIAVSVLPWLHFLFKVQETETRINPYGVVCPLHQIPVIVQEGCKSALLDVLQRRETQDWINNSLKSFPCSGVPVSEDELLACSSCRIAEEEWVARIGRSIPILDARPNSQGWIQCPGCEVRFSISDPQRFANNTHLTCGQKINLAT